MILRPARSRGQSGDVGRRGIGDAAAGFLVADLTRDGVVSSDEIRGAADAYLADRTCGPFHLRNGHAIDVAAAVERHKATVAALADPKLPAKQRQTLVQSAISLAHTIPPTPAG